MPKLSKVAKLSMFLSVTVQVVSSAYPQRTASGHQSSMSLMRIKNMVGDSGKRRRSWRTQKYLLSHPIFSQEIIADIHKSFGEADYFTKMGNIWRSFWYTGLIILLSAFNKNGNDALAGITMKKRIRRKGRTPLIPFQGQLQDVYSSIAMAEHPWKGHFLLTLGIYFIRTYFQRRLLYHLLSTNDDNTIS